MSRRGNPILSAVLSLAIGIAGAVSFGAPAVAQKHANMKPYWPPSVNAAPVLRYKPPRYRVVPRPRPRVSHRPYYPPYYRPYYRPYYDPWYYGWNRPRVTVIVPVVPVVPPVVASLPAAHIAWCDARYKTYKVRTNTFTGYDGRQHRCRSPYLP
jgi:hypothetical protein